MQTQHGLAGEEAILNPEREFRPRLKVDWGQNGTFNHELSDMSRYVNSASVDRTLSGSVPEEVLLIEGSAAAELSLTLGGEWHGQSLANIFSPYNKKSPLYGTPMVGAEVIYEIGVESPYGTLWYPQFVGNIRTISPSRGGNTVQVAALDRAEKLRAPILFPSWAISDKHKIRRKAVISQLTKSSWVIDHCLRQCDTSPTPYRPAYTREFTSVTLNPPDGTMLWVSGTGSHLPTVGWIADPYQSLYPLLEPTSRTSYERRGWRHPKCRDWDPRPYNFCGQGNNDTTDTYNYWVSNRERIVPQSYHHISFTIALAGQEGTYWQTASQRRIFEVNIGARTMIRVRVNAGTINSQTLSTSRSGTPNEGSAKTTASVTIPSDTREFARVHVVWRFVGGTVQYRIEVDENTSGDQTLSGTGWASSSFEDWRKGYCTLYTGVGISDLAYAIRNAVDGSLAVSDVSGTEATYAAVLDEGVQDFTYIPVRKGESAWQIITDVASAEFGSVFWDESGIFRFWDYSHMIELQEDTVREFTLDDVSELQFTNSLDSVRNTWSIEAGRAMATRGTVYSAQSTDEFFVSNAETTADFKIWSDTIVAPDVTPLKAYTGFADDSGRNGDLDTWDDDVTHGYIATFLTGTITWEDDEGEEQSEERWEEFPDDVEDWVDVRAYLDDDGYVVLRVENESLYSMRLATTTVKYETQTDEFEMIDANEDPCTLTEDRVEEDTSGAASASASLRIGGAVLDKFEPQITVLRSTGSVAMYGERNLRVSGDWTQDGTDLSKVSEVLMPRTLKPAPTTDAIIVAGDPRIQLGDTVSLRDSAGFGDHMRVQIYGVRRDFDLSGGLTDTLMVEMIQPVSLIIEPDVIPEIIVRTNLVDNPALRTNDDGWYTDEPNAYRRSVSGMPRPYAFYMGDDYEDMYSSDCNATPGLTYIGSVYVKASYQSLSGKLRLEWLDGNDRVGLSTAVPFTVAANNVVRISTGAVVAPSGTNAIELYIHDNTAPYYATAVLVEQSSQLGDYFDGETPGAVWNLNGSSTLTTIIEPEPTEPPHPDSEYVPPAPDGSLDPPA